MQAEIHVAWLTVNRACQFKCNWCYAQEYKKNNVMDIDIAKNVVDMLAKKGIKKIILIGGEPLLFDGIFDIIKYIHTKEIKTSLATNGYDFSNIKKCQSAKNSGLNNVNISLKGLSEEEYIEHVGISGLQKAINAYTNLKKVGINPSLSYVIVDDNLDNIIRLIKLAKLNELDHFSFQFVKPIVKKNAPDIMNMNTMGMYICDLYDMLKISGLDFSIEISFPLCLIPANRRTELLESGHVYSGCHIRRGRGIVFDTDFSVIPCNHFVNMTYSDSVNKKIVDTFIDDLWNSESVMNFKKQISNYPGKKCINCSMWDKCGGGCFTRWFKSSPEEYCKGI